MNYDIAQLNHLIRHRRSAFPQQYTGETVERSVIAQILENATWAPTHARTEPWRFFVFSGDSLKQLADNQAELYKKHTPPTLFEQAKYDKMLANPLKASHIIAICMKRHHKQIVPEIEEIEAGACAVQNMYLTTAAYGLGAYWASGGMTYMEEAKELFGLGEHDKLLGFFYIGVLAQPSPDSTRAAWQEKTTWL